MQCVASLCDFGGGCRISRHGWRRCIGWGIISFEMMVLDRTVECTALWNDCISARWLLKHYRLWNDGLRPGIGPPRRKEGSRRGRPTIVIIATPLSTSHSHHRHHHKPFQYPHFHFSSLHLDRCQQLKFLKLQGTFHSSLRGFFTEHYKMCLNVFLTSACWIILTSSHQSPFFLFPAQSSSLLFTQSRTWGQRRGFILLTNNRKRTHKKNNCINGPAKFLSNSSFNFLKFGWNI